MENKELMEAKEQCSEILLLNDYEGFFNYVKSSKFKTELIAEFKEEYEEAKENYKGDKLVKTRLEDGFSMINPDDGYDSKVEYKEIISAPDKKYRDYEKNEENKIKQQLRDLQARGIITVEEAKKYGRTCKTIEELLINISYEPLQKKVQTLKNGTKITIYEGGKPEDYGIKNADQLRVSGGMHGKPKKIEGINTKNPFFSKNQYPYMVKTKIELKEGKIVEGFINSDVLDSIKDTDVVPIMIGNNLKSLPNYSMLNLNNGLTYTTNTKLNSDLEWSEGFLTEDYRYINLDSMEPLNDEEGEEINALQCYGFYNGIAVVVTDPEIVSGNSYIRAYNKEGKIVDEIIVDMYPKSEDLETFNMKKLEEMKLTKELIIYRNGKFFSCNKYGGHQEELKYTLAHEVNPM